MTVQVCDALCGAGKTSAAIRMMNERTDERFIFVTQYVTETTRIKNSCLARNFQCPQGDEEMGQTKLSDVHRLMREGCNIATTHSLFSTYTEEMKELITQQQYILVLDEAIDVLTMTDIQRNDMDILIKSQSVREENGFIEWINTDYQDSEGGRFREEMMKAKSKNLLKYDDSYYFWSIPPELFRCFKEAYVLTYMFEAQEIRCFFEMHEIPYMLIGTHKVDGGYEFCSIEQMDRCRELRDKIHILDHERLNAIGDKRTALSVTWYKSAEDSDDEEANVDRLRKNLGNLFKNIWSVPASAVMWTTYKENQESLKGKGYESAFVSYNKRASNEYASRTHLAYCVNNFPRPWEMKYFREHGTEINGDMYALSILVQWLFRSAIRNDKEVWVYVPSARMRSLLMTWLDNLAEGRDLEPITYVSPRKKYYVPKKARKNHK